MKWFRGGLVFKACRLVYHSTPGSRAIKKKKEKIMINNKRGSREKRNSSDDAALDPADPHGGERPFHKKSTCLARSTVGPYVVQVWSRNPQHLMQQNPRSPPCGEVPHVHAPPLPPRRQPKGKLVVSSVNSHTNAARIRWHLWELDLRFAPG